MKGTSECRICLFRTAAELFLSLSFTSAEINTQNIYTHIQSKNMNHCALCIFYCERLFCFSTSCFTSDDDEFGSQTFGPL